MAEGQLTGLSVVTATRNESETLPQLIRSLRVTLKGMAHEIIVVDNSDADRTFEIAKEMADVAIKRDEPGQGPALLEGMRKAKYPTIVTIDSDMENPPEMIPSLLERMTSDLDVLVVCRDIIPRLSEELATERFRSEIGISDVFSNYRIYRSEVPRNLECRLGETFGLEILVLAKRAGYHIGQTQYHPPPRRSNPRIGGLLKANLRITWAAAKVASSGRLLAIPLFLWMVLRLAVESFWTLR